MVEVVWLVSLFLFDFLEEWSTFGKPFECHCEGGKPLWGRSRGCCHPHGSELQLELLSFWGEKMHLSFLQSFAVLAALFFSWRQKEMMKAFQPSCIHHEEEKQWAVVGGTS